MDRLLLRSAFIILIQQSSLTAYGYHHTPSHFSYDLGTDFDENYSWDENETDEDDIDDNDSKRRVSYQEIRHSRTYDGTHNTHEQRVTKLQAYGHTPLNKVTVFTTERSYGLSHQHAHTIRSVTFEGPKTLIEISDQRYDLRKPKPLTHTAIQKNTRIQGPLTDQKASFTKNPIVCPHNIHLESRSYTFHTPQNKITHKNTLPTEDKCLREAKREDVPDQKTKNTSKGLYGKIVKIS